jgi:TDG/mug DNA glycosylase family protein
MKDLIAEELTVIFCGINPGLKSAMDGHHFSGRGIRFWKVLYLAGFTPHQIQAENDATILDFGYGLTTAVERASARADELSKEEFANSLEAFKNKMEHFFRNILHSWVRLLMWHFPGKRRFHGGFSLKLSPERRFGYCPIQVV